MKTKYSQVFYNCSNKITIFTRRIIIACILIFILIIILIINLCYLQIIHFKNYNTRSNNNRIKLLPIPPSRGIIYDRNGVALAINQTIYQLEITEEKVIDLQETINSLQSIIQITNDEIIAFKKKRKNFPKFLSLPIKTDLTDVEQASFALNQFRFSGVEMKEYQYRYYPYGSTLTHVIGYVSKINAQDIKQLNSENNMQKFFITRNVGKLGIERYYENILYGKPGYEKVEVNNRGEIIRQLYKQSPEAGKNIFLTLDINLQQYIEKLLIGNRASVIVTDPRDSSIRALISNPSYDPNQFVKGISEKNFNKLLKDKNLPLLNRATQGIYPPASTIKPYISISALISGTINKNFSIFDPGWWKLPGSEKRYRDWKRTGHGYLNITKAIEESSDTFFYQIAYNMGIDNLSKWMIKFGYGQYTGIDLLEEISGIMPTKTWKMKRFKKPWYPGDTISVGIGQGYWSATPIQMSKSLMTLVNNGVVRTPHLLHAIVTDESQIYYKNTQYQICNSDSESWTIVKDAMFGAANRNNGILRNNFFDTIYKVAAKSGTAQIYSLKDNEIYNPCLISEYLRDHKLMIAFAPYHEPTIAIVVILENGGNGISIGTITRKIFDYILLSN
ncbi:peptidoglycan DD-transpeptidase MrdA [Blochmannia endosymbiont of Polyrhachis (Hedomyrma) turneri]|uniref:peptidoglycan DD-transpeptidase MrdA n=1 Tax=Blochmannia endosymbiont of Polyrhachis (Hedomyrma) turneri TaxID=1505596 RepID=UPI00061A5D9E|nr:peptidoglycan DD-transpeptidase MrdA [Blochmannia endosymbiont of Polyrhachis (Hedomyrma) turneri]AKC59881.1 Penicillin-binding protein 2 [Blochmannia endosymbiont of Polyrhachis (Hedomyrma) turneri]